MVYARASGRWTMAKDKSIIIIMGAGIVGLAAGCYAQMNGYRSQIFALHDLPGGLCTAWERKDYVFDGCIHYLLGSGACQPFNSLWEELGALKGRRFINHEEFMRAMDPGGRTLIVYCDPDRLEAHMKGLSPADGHLIEALCEDVRRFTRFDMSLLAQQPRTLMGPLDWAKLGSKMLPYVGPLAQWGLLSARAFGARFKDPFLRRAVPQMFAWPAIPMMAALSLLVYTDTGNAGSPAGASLEFARSIERRYRELGGEIHYKSEVERILVEDAADGREQRAVGVRLYSDDEHRADYVISAADGRSTIFGLLDGRFVNRATKHLYDGHLPVYSQVQISLGVNRDLSAEPHWVTYLLDGRSPLPATSATR
jgi:phytoene dehydrogenase-like protein